jgi:hypothetical protein
MPAPCALRCVSQLAGEPFRQSGGGREANTVTSLDKALLLIASIRAARAHGVRHCSLDGRLLTTDKEILEALVADGQIRLEKDDDAR